ncbi:hypothetical protein D3C87_1806850 [compost metagenome]
MGLVAPLKMSQDVEFSTHLQKSSCEKSTGGSSTYSRSSGALLFSPWAVPQPMAYSRK